jgi:CheY-like chemotaxis protein
MMSPTTILHVEDDSNDVLLLKHACERAGVGLDVQTVEDGEQAIAYLGGEGKFADRKQFPFPSLLLLDLKMPKVSGFELLDWMRADPALRKLPVIILTSSRHQTDIERAYGSGANSFLVKPVGFDELVKLVKTVCNYWFTFNLLPSFVPKFHTATV